MYKRQLLKISEDSGKMLSAILIGNNLVNNAATALTTSLIIQLFGNSAVDVYKRQLSLFLLLVSEHFPYFLLVLLVLLASVPVLLVFLHLDSLAVPVSDLGSLAVPAFDLGSPAVLAFDPDSPAVPVSDPALVILHYIPNVPLPGD